MEAKVHYVSYDFYKNMSGGNQHNPVHAPKGGAALSRYRTIGTDTAVPADVRACYYGRTYGYVVGTYACPCTCIGG